MIMTRLQEHYQTTLKPALIKEFGYTNPMQAPKLDKIIINMGVRQRTAETLGINRTTLFNKMRKYHLLAFPAKPPKMREKPGNPDSDLGQAG